MGRVSKAKTEEIRAGIAAYHRERNVLLRVLRRFGPISEFRFDAIFGGRYNRLFIPPMRNDAFILGFGAFDYQRAFYLQLMQALMVLGEVDAKKVNGVVMYALKRGRSQ